MIWYKQLSCFVALISAASLVAADQLQALSRQLQQKYGVQLNGNTTKYDFVLTDGYASPDGYEKHLILINGQYPGPAIRVRKGDTLVLNITNQMASGNKIAIHLHGLDSILTPQNDGAAFLTQYPIAPGQSYVIKQYIVNEPGGTYWYHAHFMQTGEQLYGPIIIEDDGVDHLVDTLGEQYRYDEERVLMLSDNFHAKEDDMTSGLLMTPFKWIGDPQSILFNGNGQFNCSSLSSSSGDSGDVSKCNQSLASMESFQVEKDKVYRFRIVGASTLSYFKLSMDLHEMTIIEVDGIYVQPFRVTELEINSAQRYSVLVRMSDPSAVGKYMIKAQVAYRKSGPIGYAMLSYKDSAEDKTSVKVGSLFTQNNTKSDPNWILSHLKPAIDLSEEATILKDSSNMQRIHLHMQQSLLPVLKSDGTYENKTKWLINGGAFDMMSLSEPALHAAFKGRDHMNKVLSSAVSGVHSNGTLMSAEEAMKAVIFEIDFERTIEVILQNTVAMNGICEQHPFHLHGYHVFDFASGPGEYKLDSAEVAQATNLQDPLFRDTVTVYPYEHDFASNLQTNTTGKPGAPCGWRVIRFKADNPGVWPMHCHINSHMTMGMSILFIDSYDQLIEMAPLLDLDASDGSLYQAGTFNESSVVGQQQNDASHSLGDSLSSSLTEDDFVSGSTSTFQSLSPIYVVGLMVVLCALTFNILE
ncbi:hypothetical protein MP228_013058 [Amoeboaphelidium protococcarum]|nr:hypothetical protein MP228_013058 [Amoeboaphelidium protococcarum]